MGLLAALTVSAWPASGQAAPEGGADADSLRPTIDALVIKAPEELELRPVLELRMPQRPLYLFGESFTAEAGSLHAFVEVRQEPEAWSFSVILSDGRAFFRSVSVGEEDPARVLASSLESLLAAIEEERVEADATEQEIPEEAQPEPNPEEDVEPEEELEPAPEPEPEPPAPVQAEPERAWTHLSLLGGGSVGLTEPAGGRSGGVTLWADYRFEKGAALALMVGQEFAGGETLLLSRTRVAIGGGYSFRGDRLEVPVWLLAGVEPWAVFSEGETKGVLDDRGETFRAPLLSAGLKSGARIRFDLPRREHLRLFVDLSAEAWLGGVSPSFSALRITRGRQVALGGVELRAGLGIGLEFGHLGR